MQRVNRFAPLVILIALAIVALCPNVLRQRIVDQQGAIAVLTAERDAVKTQVEISKMHVVDNDAALKDAQTKIAELQAQLETTNIPTRRRR